MICQRCQIDRPIGDFKRHPSKRRARRCRYCHGWMTRRVNHWHEHGRACKRCGVVKPCPAQISDSDRERDGICKACMKVKERDRQREWTKTKRATDPDFRRRQIDATIRWQKRNKAYVIDAEHKRYARKRKDPKRWARHLEDSRMRYRLRQERAGRPLAPVREITYLKRYGLWRSKNAPHVSAEPVRELLRGVEDLAAFADGVRLSESFIDRVRQGHYQQISLRDADAICLGFNLPMRLVYGEAAA